METPPVHGGGGEDVGEMGAEMIRVEFAFGGALAVVAVRVLEIDLDRLLAENGINFDGLIPVFGGEHALVDQGFHKTLVGRDGDRAVFCVNVVPLALILPVLIDIIDSMSFGKEFEEARKAGNFNGLRLDGSRQAKQ